MTWMRGRTGVSLSKKNGAVRGGRGVSQACQKSAPGPLLELIPFRGAEHKDQLGEVAESASGDS